MCNESKIIYIFLRVCSSLTLYWKPLLRIKRKGNETEKQTVVLNILLVFWHSGLLLEVTEK